jgi:hypothetical protein
MVWEKRGDTFFATATDAAGEPRYHLIVETGAADYDWAVWRSGQDRSVARHGRAATRHGAMWDAEQAVEKVSVRQGETGAR